MAKNITLQDYLNNDPGVKEAKKIFDEATKSLTGARNVTPDVLAELQQIKSRAEQVYKKLVSDTTIYFKKNYVGISTSGISDSIAKLEELKKSAPSQDALDSIQTSINTLTENLKNPKPYKEPIVKVKKSKDLEKITTDQETKKRTDLTTEIQSQYTSEVAIAGQRIAEMGDTARRILAEDLNKAYSLKLPLDGKYSKELKSAYVTALSDNYVRSLDYNRNTPFAEFLIIAGNEGTYRSGANAGPTLGGTISSPTGAADLIESAIKTELGRTPSAAERKELTEKLNAAERKNPSKTIKGITTQGLDKEQFLREEVRKIVDPTTGKSEYENKKVQKRSVTTQSLLTTINANGLKIPQSQIDTWSTAVENGTDIKIINNEIRNIAGLGMPENVQKLLNQGTDLDAIVSPYKQVMARVLELNPNSISVNDSLLRDAIGGNYSKVTATPGMGSVSRGEYSMYEFEKALRKDYRWQFTNTAKEDVFESVNKVFKDFGLQG